MATQTRALAAPAITVRLGRGRTWGSVVRDQNEAPVAGARVRLNSWMDAGDSTPLGAGKEPGGSFSTVDEAWAVETVTDAQGRWQLNDLPQSGGASIVVVGASYARNSYELNLSDPGAPPLFVKPGATIEGQIL